MTKEEIDHNFKYHPPTESKHELYFKIREKAKELANIIQMEVPEGREKSLAMTKLEETVMWANSGIARG